MKKSNLWTIIIIIAVIILSFIILEKPKVPVTTEEISRCIGKNSILYIQLGCGHCKDQEDMFGNNAQYLTKVDCFFEREKCSNDEITATPTWTIKGQKYEGVQEIETLRNLTGC